MIQTPSLQLSQGTAAEFRAWGSGLSAAIQAVGLVKTADTGQINWATVGAPTTFTQSMGYEIFRFADALQGTAPVFIRIEYGSGNTALPPAIWVTIGSGTNGAGVLTGVVSATGYLAVQTPATAAVPCIVCGATNRLGFALKCAADVSAANNMFIFVNIERSHDSFGNDTGTGVHAVGHAIITAPGGGQTAIPWNLTLDFTNTYVVPARAYFPTLVHDGTAWQAGANVGVAPMLPVGMGIWNPGLGAAAYFNSDITAGNIISISPYGAAHSYIALGAWSAGIHGNANLRMLMRYE